MRFQGIGRKQRLKKIKIPAACEPIVPLFARLLIMGRRLLESEIAYRRTGDTIDELPVHAFVKEREIQFLAINVRQVRQKRKAVNEGKVRIQCNGNRSRKLLVDLLGQSNREFPHVGDDIIAVKRAEQG